ncbi:hypothetical protein M878_40970 [Streptomyces roseochromogenus subsp. oscitans DS 12.976]|uniref:Uncharacterized protein n=1 Tax=Streptomyces roseochromogenus subsp. oscitans DS 12.976 TaxID=1352936 RepID=V6JJ59_STRRC|nr:hypothetical protein M878_40970 [Streptomyces roseochromogenus subsp. oscitans DS 12.976]
MPAGTSSPSGWLTSPGRSRLGAAALDLRPLRAHHLDLGDRMRGPELAQHRNQQRHGRRVDGADAHHAADAMLLAGRGPQPFHRLQHAHEVWQQLPARSAHHGARPLPLQQVDSRFPFPIAYGLAQRGLRHPVTPS